MWGGGWRKAKQKLGVRMEKASKVVHTLPPSVWKKRIFITSLTKNFIKKFNFDALGLQTSTKLFLFLLAHEKDKAKQSISSPPLTFPLLLHYTI